jgi:hypothetical protein
LLSQHFLLWLSDKGKGTYSDKGIEELLRVSGASPISSLMLFGGYATRTRNEIWNLSAQFLDLCCRRLYHRRSCDCSICVSDSRNL